MTNLLTPLKKLGKKLTGKDISGTNLVTVVDDIANKYEGSGGGGGGDIPVVGASNIINLDFPEIYQNPMRAISIYGSDYNNQIVAYQTQIPVSDIHMDSIFHSNGSGFINLQYSEICYKIQKCFWEYDDSDEEEMSICLRPYFIYEKSDHSLYLDHSIPYAYRFFCDKKYAMFWIEENADFYNFNADDCDLSGLVDDVLYLLDFRFPNG